ncbi:MAG TPA: hypothetical protein VFX86_03780 [Candidatus Saccharimonadales bacterium]|nr:hypothetical protein [Candidatus Saccharimonadales bacterium]
MNMKPRVIFIVILSVLVISTIAAYHILNSSNNKKYAPAASNDISFSGPSSFSSPPSSSTTKSTTVQALPDKEELSKPPERRPVQYIHVCEETSSNTFYVTQGKPNCLPGGVFQFDYSTDVPGVVYSTPCQTTDDASKLRYVYISEDATCPAGTEAVPLN